MLMAALLVSSLALGTALEPVPAAMQAEDDAKEKPRDPRAENRFAQSVRVGDLPGRRLLAPEESQHILGWVDGVVKGPDGDAQLVVEIGGALARFGIGTRLVLVSVGDVALLGEHVALMDVDPEDLQKLPTYKPGSQAALPANATIKIGIVKPFH
ncbi:hypothetical protein [Sphingomonas sp. PAMC 26605]|uniref:hypothetical protein n=1 Tax=Sphingomonas sp. PAMC 26605 TaxID=1112214 RepID=UPI000308E153|nr:hypothetical protein [Sphingomonas sp. PAMC 26605]